MDVLKKTAKIALVLFSFQLSACALVPNKDKAQIQKDEKAQQSGDRLVEVMRRRSDRR